MTPSARYYCRAYRLADLRRFPGWADGAGPGDADMPDDTVVYLWNDLSVVTDPVVPGAAALRAATDPQDAAWQDFCRTQLDFETPEE